MAQAQTLIASIDKEKDWAWAASRDMHKELKEKVAGMKKQVEANHFMQSAIQDLNALKKTTEPGKFEREIKKVLNIEGPLEAISKECRVLLKQHQARMEA
eukprot:8741606-Alexandrium_andersonii.AAC.1